MNAQVRASIDLYGDTLRYAEVEHYGGRRRLLRLGSCDFDYDASRHLYGQVQDSQLHPLTEALGDIFGELSTDELQLVVHPGEALSFSSPAPAELEGAALANWLHSEAILLSGEERAEQEYDLLTHSMGAPVNTDEKVWYHCVAVPRSLTERVTDVLGRIGAGDFSYRFSPACAAEVVSRLVESAEGTTQPDRKYLTAVLGWYENHVEVTLMDAGKGLFFQHVASVPPTDSVYVTLRLLEQLQLSIADLADVFVYGHAPDMDEFALFEAITGNAPRHVDPIQLLDLEPGSLVESFDASAYTPALGAVM